MLVFRIKIEITHLMCISNPHSTAPTSLSVVMVEKSIKSRNSLSAGSCIRCVREYNHPQQDLQPIMARPHRASAEPNFLIRQFILDPLFTDHVHFLVLWELKDTLDVESGSVCGTEYLILICKAHPSSATIATGVIDK